MAPAHGISVVTQALDVMIKTRKHESHILKEVDFAAKPGEMVAIMGPSGSGKTTFLNVLAGRASKKMLVNGKVYFNGRESTARRTRDFTAYVMQEDSFLEYLTVQETINFAAQLRLRGWTPKARAERVEECLRDMGLVPCRDVLVGGPTVKGISGGQRKRVSIAVALLPNPQLLFLDEPTSGLDASLAYDVIKILENITQVHGRTVLCTIHQPRSQVYGLFDTLLLFREGSVVYRGPASDAVNFFGSIGYPCPAEFNPPDFFLDLLSGDNSTAEVETPSDEGVTKEHDILLQTTNEPSIAVSDESYLMADEVGAKKEPFDEIRQRSIVRVVVDAHKASLFALEYQKSSYAEEQRRIAKELLADASDIIIDTSFTRKPTAGDWVKSIGVLAERDVINQRRQPTEYIAQGISLLISGIMIGTMWWQIKAPDVTLGCEATNTSMRNLLGGLLQLLGNTSFTSGDVALQTVQRRPLMNREAGSGLYSYGARILASRIADMAFIYWPPLIMSILCYWFMGLKATAAGFFTFLLLVILIKFAANSFAILCGGLAPTTTVAASLVPMGAVLFFFVSGMQIADSDIPGWLVWLKNISFTRFGFQAFVRDQLSDEAYLYECAHFRTPTSVWGNLGITFAVGVGFSLLAALVQCTLHRGSGMEA